MRYSLMTPGTEDTRQMISLKLQVIKVVIAKETVQPD